MKDGKSKLSAEEQKQKIRDRYGRMSTDSLIVIPAKPKENIYEPTEMQRVGVYARVSTDSTQQTSSYELQRNYYEDMVRKQPLWQLVDIYADEGISGTSLKHREAFQRMIDDCRAGKIDVIIVKSVSRFARNIVDCLQTVRELKSLKRPVGVMFETERIYTLEGQEMSLSFLATLAQEESHNKSESMNRSYEMRFSHELFMTPALLGYDKDEDGNLVINEEEAKTVRLIFYMFLYGYTIKEIAETLEKYEQKTKKGNTVWSESSILGILQNERHCGDVRAHKTWTPSYLDHKSKKNNGDLPQYYKEDHHDAIVSRECFMAVQKRIANLRWQSEGIFPRLNVIDTGLLAGYVVVNPKWGGFTLEDYRRAADSIVPKNAASADDGEETIGVEKGSFDLRGYQVIHGQWINGPNEKIALSTTDKKIHFSSAAVTRFAKDSKVEILVSVDKGMIAVRKAEKGSRNAIQWTTVSGQNKICSRDIPGTAFLPVFYELFGWKEDCRYVIEGEYRKKKNEEVLLFRASDAVLYTTRGELTGDEDDSTQVCAYPKDWVSSFGTPYYSRYKESQDTENVKKWNVAAEGKVYKHPDDTTDPEQVRNQINEIIGQLEKEKEKVNYSGNS